MELTYHGHSCFIISGGGHSVIVDPFLNGNPLAVIKPYDVNVDAILVTHAHADHLGDAVEISRKTGRPIIGTFELVNYCTSKGATGHPMHIGGGKDFDFGRVKLTIAHHGSSTESGPAGNPCGFVVTMNGKSVYHAGDTGVFYDMALIGEMDKIDCALVPIGDNFTMGVNDAAKAIELLKARLAVPMHYNTFDLIKQDPEKFRKALKGKCTVEVLKPGEKITL